MEMNQELNVQQQQKGAGAANTNTWRSVESDWSLTKIQVWFRFVSTVSDAPFLSEMAPWEDAPTIQEHAFICFEIGSKVDAPTGRMALTGGTLLLQGLA